MSQTVANIDYEGFDPATIPRDLFIPGIHQNLWDVRPISDKPNEFTASATNQPRWGRLFGGVFIAQAVVAAIKSLPQKIQDKFYLHNLQAVWLRTGYEDIPITYRVTVLKQQGKYINLQVTSHQKGDEPSFIAIVSFVSIAEKNTHQHNIPAKPIDFGSLPDPRDLKVAGHYYLEQAQYHLNRGDKESAQAIANSTQTMVYIVKPLEPTNDHVAYIQPTAEELNRNPKMLKQPRLPRSLFYIKWPQTPAKMFNLPILDDPLKFPPTIQYNKIPFNTPLESISLLQHLNIAALVYVSDFLMIGQCVKPHVDIHPMPLNVQFSSLNHNLSIITPNFSLFEDYLIFDSSSPYMAYSRGQLMGIFYRRDGVPVAFVTQQTVARVHENNDIASKFPNPFASKTTGTIIMQPESSSITTTQQPSAKL